MSANGAPRLPRSRRDRPAKPALTRERVVEAALAVMRADGLGKVTMRRVAAALDTGPASLYVYVRDTEDLHAQVLDALLEPVAASVPAGGPWRERLTALLARYRDVLYDHPELARMAMGTPASGPNYLALVEAVLALLVEAGVPDRTAAWGVDLLLLYVTADAAEHGSWRSSGRAEADFSALASAVTTADAGRYPQLARLSGIVLAGAASERFEWAIDVVLAGLVAHRDPADGAADRPGGEASP